jgi:tetratricopeptide (TPR) repeat protein
MRLSLCFACLVVAVAAPADELESARDRQDRGALQAKVNQLNVLAEKHSSDAQTQYLLALGQSYLADVAMELKDKNQARIAAEAGIRAAERAVALRPNSPEYHRVLGTLCGQVIPANILFGLKYGKCAQEEIKKAIELSPQSASTYLSRGVGNYYLPPAMGGGLDLAMNDFRKAIQLDPKLAEAHLWLGIALRKANRNREAHAALTRAVELNPGRVWARQQLEKTPAK